MNMRLWEIHHRLIGKYFIEQISRKRDVMLKLRALGSSREMP